MNIEEIKQLVPDDKGIITVNVDGVDKRFVQEKLIQFLLKKEKRFTKPVPKRKSKKPKKIRGAFGSHRKRAVIATGKDGVEIRFDSSAAAANALGFDKNSKNNIPHALSGKYKTVGGYKFKYAEIKA